MGHRQAWVWQDEWYGLTIEDIRKLEEETQRILARKMGTLSETNKVNSCLSLDHDSDQEIGFASDKGRGSVVYVQDNNNGTKLDLISKTSLDDSEGSISPSPVAITVEKFGYDEENPSQILHEKLSMKISHGLECNGLGQKERSPSFDSSSARGLLRAEMLMGWRMSTIETVESDSGEEEFFDAQGMVWNLTLTLSVVSLDTNSNVPVFRYPAYDY